MQIRHENGSTIEGDGTPPDNCSRGTSSQKVFLLPDPHTHTGDPPLVVQGQPIATAASKQPPKRGRSYLKTHWHELAPYLTPSSSTSQRSPTSRRGQAS